MYMDTDIYSLFGHTCDILRSQTIVNELGETMSNSAPTVVYPDIYCVYKPLISDMAVAGTALSSNSNLIMLHIPLYTMDNTLIELTERDLVRISGVTYTILNIIKLKDNGIYKIKLVK